MHCHGSAEPGSLDANLDPGPDGEVADLGFRTDAMSAAYSRFSTSSELIQMVGEALYGSRYESELAGALGVNRRTARRWRTGDTAPGAGVWRDLLVLLRARAWHLEGLASEVRRRF